MVAKHDGHSTLVAEPDGGKVAEPDGGKVAEHDGGSKAW